MSEIIVIAANALTWLAREVEVATRQFDCIITDPPYDSLMKWQGIGTTARMGFGAGKDAADSDKFYPTIDGDQMQEVLWALADLAKKNSHTYILCDHEYMPRILGWVRESGELPWNYSKPLVWDKINAGMGYHWRGTHEYVVMLEKGKRRLNDLGKQDILRHKRVAGGGALSDREAAGVDRGTVAQFHQGRRLDTRPFLRGWHNRRSLPKAQSELRHHRHFRAGHHSHETAT